MNAESASTEAVVRHHLRAFLDQQGVTAIVSDYDDNASFCSETRIYRGKHEIADFFTEFIASLPVNAIERFTLRSLQVDRNIACITWSVGSDILLGTDTFVVHRGKIVSQTFAMLTAPGSMVHWTRSGRKTGTSGCSSKVPTAKTSPRTRRLI